MEGWEPYFTHVTKKLAESIGQFMVAWGRLESELDSLTPIVFRTDPTHATCITANLGSKAKVDMLRSGINMIAALLPPDLVEELNDSLVLVGELSGTYRNLLAHGQPWAVSEGGEKTYWQWVRVSARKEVNVISPDINEDFWRIATVSTYEVIHSLRSCAGRLYEVTRDISAEDWADACSIQSPPE